jgi:hypothetical protein
VSASWRKLQEASLRWLDRSWHFSHSGFVFISDLSPFGSDEYSGIEFLAHGLSAPLARIDQSRDVLRGVTRRAPDASVRRAFAAGERIWLERVTSDAVLRTRHRQAIVRPPDELVTRIRKLNDKLNEDGAMPSAAARLLHLLTGRPPKQFKDVPEAVLAELYTRERKWDADIQASIRMLWGVTHSLEPDVVRDDFAMAANRWADDTSDWKKLPPEFHYLWSAWKYARLRAEITNHLQKAYFPEMDENTLASVRNHIKEMLNPTKSCPLSAAELFPKWASALPFRGRVPPAEMNWTALGWSIGARIVLGLALFHFVSTRIFDGTPLRFTWILFIVATLLAGSMSFHAFRVHWDSAEGLRPSGAGAFLTALAWGALLLHNRPAAAWRRKYASTTAVVYAGLIGVLLCLVATRWPAIEGSPMMAIFMLLLYFESVRVATGPWCSKPASGIAGVLTVGIFLVLTNETPRGAMAGWAWGWALTYVIVTVIILGSVLYHRVRHRKILTRGATA